MKRPTVHSQKESMIFWYFASVAGCMISFMLAHENAYQNFGTDSKKKKQIEEVLACTIFILLRLEKNLWCQYGDENLKQQDFFKIMSLLTIEVQSAYLLLEMSLCTAVQQSPEHMNETLTSWKNNRQNNSLMFENKRLNPKK